MHAAATTSPTESAEKQIKNCAVDIQLVAGSLSWASGGGKRAERSNDGITPVAGRILGSFGEEVVSQ